MGNGKKKNNLVGNALYNFSPSRLGAADGDGAGAGALVDDIDGTGAGSSCACPKELWITVMDGLRNQHTFQVHDGDLIHREVHHVCTLPPRSGWTRTIPVVRFLSTSVGLSYSRPSMGFLDGESPCLASSCVVDGTHPVYAKWNDLLRLCLMIHVWVLSVRLAPSSVLIATWARTWRLILMLMLLTLLLVYRANAA
ncbi:hypothetical protein BYT27DRAFT_7206766 [Phlegmacium glaucopus]|nr:hypothetical protein BYT27DRAFT_7206766 [Phlegmacium glaucopus]